MLAAAARVSNNFFLKRKYGWREGSFLGTLYLASRGVHEV
jgi:hypothetical protein